MQKEKFDIKIRTYNYALSVIRILDKLPRDNASMTISKQLLRSATSVGANVIEAQAAGTRKDFANFYNHSLKSANESKFWISLLKDAQKMNEVDFMPLIRETNEIANILAASIITLRGKRNF